MIVLKENLEKFIPPVYGKTKRTVSTYKTVADYCKKNLSRLITEYKSIENDQQLLREIRNDIDNYLRRYHEYCIKQRDNMDAHYREINPDADTDFEHLIPASRVRDLLLAGSIDIEQALNCPTVQLSRSKHKELREAGWGSHTPSMWFPFKRYFQVFPDIHYETFDGISIDPDKWTLQDHFDYFKHLSI